MCGRFTLRVDYAALVESFSPGERICGQAAGAILSPGAQVSAMIHDAKPRLVCLQWGLIPAWAGDPSIGKKMFNARAETLTEKPSFRNAFRERRCAILADGFYEWERRGQGTRPVHFSLRSGAPFCFAGLYETWVSPGRESLRTCTVITVEANDLIRPVHDRMPAMLSPVQAARWIHPGIRNPEELRALLKPYPSGEMKISEGLPGALHA